MSSVRVVSINLGTTANAKWRVEAVCDGLEVAHEMVERAIQRDNMKVRKLNDTQYAFDNESASHAGAHLAFMIEHFVVLDAAE